MFDLIREIGQTMRNNRLRTVLTGVAVAWGIFMLIILLGIAQAQRDSFAKNMGSQLSNQIVFWGGRTSKPYKGYKDGRSIDLHNSDIDVISSEHPDIVSEVAPLASNGEATISSTKDYISGGFSAVGPSIQQKEGLTMTHGRFINARDEEQKRKVMVLRDENARVLFGDESRAVGKTVESMGLTWTVIGIYTHDWNRDSYVPYATYKSLTGNKLEVYQLNVTVEGLKTKQDGKDAEQALRGTLARVHEFDATDRSALWSWNQFSQYLEAQAGMGYLNITFWVIGILTLLTGIVGVSNIMFVSVRERTHEIGIRRAIGARPRQILTQILAESVAITTLFGYGGVVAGLLVLELVHRGLGETDFFGDPTISVGTAFQVLTALILAGVFAGLFPALRALKVKPVEALRDE